MRKREEVLALEEGRKFSTMEKNAWSWNQKPFA
jgi:hypothetical protein